MSDAKGLWDRVRAAFKAHQTPIDSTPQAALNRIAAKCIGFSFDPSNCDVHEEHLTLDELRRLKRHSEDDGRPHREVEPIVVLVYGGQRFVIDGRRRVTKWLNEGIDRPRAAIIITPRG
jgi:hypothetical protein